MGVSTRAIWYTLVGHIVFFAALGFVELLAPARACNDGLAGPLTNAGMTVDQQCSSLLKNPVGALVVFGLAKYHILFFLMSLVAAFGFSSQPAASRLALQRALLVLHATNFAADVSWACLHVQWIGAGYIALLPQTALVVWNLRCGLAAVE